MRNKILGEYIRHQRKIKHMTLQQLASRCDISSAYLSRIERGEGIGKEVSPSIDLLDKFAIILQLPLENMLRISGYIEDRSNQNLYPYVEEFLKQVKVQEFHRLPIEQLGTSEKEYLYDKIVQIIDSFSLKYHQ